MKDDEVKQNILKCSRCGLCQGVCPIFEIKKNEQAAARGKLMQILGLKKGDLKLNRKILQSLDLCLHCEKCKLNCPSGVDTTGVFCAEKKFGVWAKFLNSQFIFNTKMTMLDFFSVFKKKREYDKTSRIVYFEGCLAKKLKTNFYMPGLKLKNGDFKCCGIPYLTKGREDIYTKIAAYNEKIIEKADMVIFDCATCFSAVKNYPFKNPKNKEKLVFYTDFYKKQSLCLKKPLSVAYHIPCHLKSAGIETEEISNILNNIKNLTYKPLSNPEDCCGFGGDFFIRHPKIASTLSLKKAKDVASSGCDVVLTSCPTCLWSLKYSLFVYKITHKFAKTPKAYDMAEFINKFCEIKIEPQLPKKETVKELIQV